VAVRGAWSMTEGSGEDEAAFPLLRKFDLAPLFNSFRFELARDTALD